MKVSRRHFLQPTAISTLGGVVTFSDCTSSSAPRNDYADLDEILAQPVLKKNSLRVRPS